MLAKIPTVQELHRRFREISENTKSVNQKPGDILTIILQLDLFKFSMEEGDCFAIQEIDANNWQIDLKISHGNQLFTIGSVYLNDFSNSSKANMTFSNSVVEEMVLQKKSFANTQTTWKWSPIPEEEALAFIKQYRKAKNAAEPYLSANLDHYAGYKKRWLQEKHQDVRTLLKNVITNPKDNSVVNFRRSDLNFLNGESDGQLVFMFGFITLFSLALFGFGIYALSAGIPVGGDKLFGGIAYFTIGSIMSAGSILAIIIGNRDEPAKRELDQLIDQAQKLSPEATQLLTQNHLENELSQNPKAEQAKSNFYYGQVFSQKSEKGNKVQWPVHYSEEQKNNVVNVS